jgi:hypothetical protein
MMHGQKNIKSSRLFYSMDELRFHIAVQTVLNTERKQKFEVASNIRRGKTVAIVLCVNAADVTGSISPYSLTVRIKNWILNLHFL